MAVWLVAEDRLHIVRASHVTALSVAPAGPCHGGGTAPAEPGPGGTVPAEPGPGGTVPAEPGPGGSMRVLVGTALGGDTGGDTWTALLTFASPGDDRTAVRVLEELAVTLSQAQARDRVGSEPVLFVHGPLPGPDGRLEGGKVWHISSELPARDWPSPAGDFATDPGEGPSSGDTAPFGPLPLRRLAGVRPAPFGAHSAAARSSGAATPGPRLPGSRLPGPRLPGSLGPLRTVRHGASPE